MVHPKKSEIITVGEFSHVIGRKWEDHELVALADELLKWMEEDESRLWFRRFFTQKRIGRNTVKRLVGRNEYLEEIYSLVKDIQEDRLVERGLTGKGNQVFVIMTLKNVSGWRSEPVEPEEEEDHLLIVDWYDEEKRKQEEEEALARLREERIQQNMERLRNEQGSKDASND